MLRRRHSFPDGDFLGEGKEKNRLALGQDEENSKGMHIGTPSLFDHLP